MLGNRKLERTLEKLEGHPAQLIRYSSGSCTTIGTGTQEVVETSSPSREVKKNLRQSIDLFRNLE